jgi:hypothetical protein
MKTLDHNAVARSLKAVVQIPISIDRKKHEGDAYKLTEVLQQYQLDISGTTGADANTDFNVDFQETLYYAPTQRNIKTEDPQFTWGAQLDKGDAGFFVYVTKWKLDDSANYTGATIRVVVHEFDFAPSSNFSGAIHVTFQGMGVPVEDPGYTDTP